MKHRFSCILLAAALCTALTSCGGKSTSSERQIQSSSNEEVTTAESASSGETEQSEEITSTSQDNEELTTDVGGSPQTTTAAEESPQQQIEKAKEGYSSPYEAAQYYYNAYLSDNYELVYNMFCQPEINAYNAYIDSLELFEAPAASVFRKSAVTDAVKKSMASIDALRADDSDSENDVWTVSLNEEDIIISSDEDMAQFNETLGTSFTSGADCGYIYYQNTANQKAFVGNGCAFVEYDGHWYLSYASAMQSELIAYMDIF